MKKKILILSDLHFGESRESTTNPGLVRQANTQAKDSFTNFIPNFKKHSPDLVVNLGDGLRDLYIKEKDTENLSQSINLIDKINDNTVHLIGNHELRAFTYGDLVKLFDSETKNSDLFGVMDLGGFQIVWLDLLLDEDNNAYLKEERLKWIDSITDKKKPTIVFSHYSLIPIDPVGSFYFEKQASAMHYENYKQINSVLKILNVKVNINAHVHLLTHQVIDKVHYISNPSFSENIAAENYPENNPGIYSILEIDDNSFVFTTYSGDFCFGKLQGELNSI